MLAGLDLRPEDEVVTTDAEHPGLLGPLHASGARVRVVEVGARPAAEALDRLAGAVSPRTKLLALSHVLWTTGQAMPVHELRKQTGLPVLVELGALDVMASMSSDLEAFLQENFEKKGNKWYVREKDFGTLDAHIPLRTRLHLFIPSIINRLDKEKKEFSIDDIFQNLLPLLVNGKTPDKHEIVTVLERYAKETPTGGNWQRRRDTKQIDIFEASRKASQILPELPLTDDHNQVLKILGTLGQYAGCSVHIGKKERRQDAELAELSIENLAIHGLPSQALRIVEQIDVLWLRDGTVVSAFEVEGSTPVYSGLARFDDLVKLVPNIRIKAYIVFPPSREGVVRLQFGRLAFQELARREGWKFITYEQLFDFFETIRGQRIKIRPESLDEIAVNPFET